jgi:CheY-like chemotaxis protein
LLRGKARRDTSLVCPLATINFAPDRNLTALHTTAAPVDLGSAAARDLPLEAATSPDKLNIMPRILAIEPETDRGVLLQQLVRESLNTDLVLATSTSAAIRAMAGSRPDLILASMLLGANEEQELIAHLRATSSLRHIPVLTIPAVTGSSAIETRAKGLFARFRRRQPAAWPMYNFNAVITRIEEALDQSKLAAARTEQEAEEDALDAIVEPVAAPMIEPIVEKTADTPVHRVLDSELVSSGSRKRARRLPVSDVPWLSNVKLAWGHSLRLLNISSSGVLVESGVRLSPGSTTKIQLDGTGLALTVPARVIRCRVSDVNSLGVTYETAAMFDRPVAELIVAEEDPTDTGARLDDLVAAVKANAACGIRPAELRSAFETGVLDLITAREVRLRDVPVADHDGRESIYFTVPALDGARAVLQVTFNANDAPGSEDFDVLTAAARSAATILPLTGTTKHAPLELQIA